MASSVDFKTGDKVGILGTGLVGRGWAMLFAAYGFRVSLYDVNSAQVQVALDDIKVQLENLRENGLLRGKLTVDEQMQLMSIANTLEECIESAIYVQESLPENLEKRKTMYKELDLIVKPGTILASSTSTMPSSIFAGEIDHRNQVLVVHPVHPTYYLRLAEVVPSTNTDPAVTERTLAILKYIEQTPVLEKKELTGFACNFINSVLLHECWRLVQEDIICPEDMDKLIRNGMALRMALLGVFQSAHFSANGFADMIEKYGAYFVQLREISRSQKVEIAPENDTCLRIARAMNTQVPLDEVDDRRRDYLRHLALLSKFTSELSN